MLLTEPALTFSLVNQTSIPPHKSETQPQCPLSQHPRELWNGIPVELRKVLADSNITEMK